MPLEQQVGQTLRLLELLIWEDSGLRSLLEGEGLEPEDVRVTYAIAMTGPSTAIVEFVEGAKTLRDVREGRGRQGSLRERFLAPADRSTLLAYLRQHNANKDMMKPALAKLAFTAAVSAVLSFVAGLGDRHHENFMATTDGRLLHVDYGYALGREPLDSRLIHFVSGGRPPTLLQYEELMEVLSPDLLQRLFWPTVRRAYLCARGHTGLFAEMVFTAVARDPSFVHNPRAKAWARAQEFVASRCVPSMAEPSAEQFVTALFYHCARNEDGAWLRDQLKGLNFKERAQQGFFWVCDAAVQTSMGASTAVGNAATAAVGGAAPALRRGSREATAAAKGAAAGILGGIRGLLPESASGQLEDDEEEESW